MFKAIRNLARGYESYMTYRSREMARDYLLRCDNRMLEDNGFSRELLTQGVKAWPWRTIEAQEVQLGAVIDHASRRQAKQDLTTMSDTELQDLGISRGLIEQAVTSGRLGIEAHEHLKVA